MKTFYFQILNNDGVKEVISTSGETFPEAKNRAKYFGKVLKTIPFGKVSSK